MATSHDEPELSPTAVTPPHLAAKILRERGSIEGERRTVTVLFVDAVGSVSTGEKLAHEELHRMVRECAARMAEAVHRYEGTVAQFRGDGIMALFGAPIAHEDTARRGIAAALAMRESLQDYERELRASGSKAFTYRIGLNTGPVIVGKIGDDLSMDYTAIGDTVNLASRMEQWAPPGKIYVTDATRRMAPGYLEFSDLGTLEVKGKAELVQAWEVERERSSRTRLDAAVDQGLTPYVGREHQLSILHGHLDQAKAGQGQVVFVSGDAGIGKSRLLLEFQRSLDGQDVTWLKGQCISYGRNIPYLPIIELLKRNLNIDDGDDEVTITRRIDERALNWDEATRPAAPYVKFLFNVDPGDQRVAEMDPMERRAGVLDALRSLLIRGSSQRPVVMVIEDLHWIDEKSEEAIAALVEVAATARVLMILTYRPGYAHSLGDRAYYSRIALQSLASEDSGALLGHVLNVERCPEEIRALITAKAEGNPFYIEEVTKSLIESGAVKRSNGTLTLTRAISELYVPETIEEVILTRIDRLAGDAREAIQLASVIGREFTARLLDRMSEAQTRLEGVLGELKGLELIYEKAYFPELSFMFKHALTHDVAYSTLLEERRKALHRIVAAAIEELYADRLAEQYETLAYHYGRGDQWDKALQYLSQAGDKAAASFANHEAIQYYGEALDVTARIGASADVAAASIVERKADVHQTIGEFVEAMRDYRTAADLARKRGDQHAEGMALGKLGVASFWNHDDSAETRTALMAALRIGERGFSDVRLYANTWLLESFIAYGEISEARPYYAAAADLAPEVHDATIIADWAWIGGMPPHWLGRFDEALDHLERWGKSAEDSHRPVALLTNRWVEALSRGAKGQYSQALDLLTEGLATCDRVGEVAMRARILNTLGWLHAEVESHELAARWSYEGIDAAQRVDAPDPECEANARLNLADALVALGRLNEAQGHYAWVERVLRHPAPAERFALWVYGQHLLHSYGEYWLLVGEHSRALEFADECIEQSESTGRLKNVVKGHRLRGQVLMALGKFDEAEVSLLRAVNIAREVGSPAQLWKSHAAVGDLRIEQERTDDARDQYREAMRALEAMAAGLTHAELRSGLLGSDAMGRIREAALLRS